MTNLHFGKAADTTANLQSDSPTVYFKWRFQRARVSLTTVAGGGNRRVTMGIGPAAGQGEIILDTGNVAGGLTQVATGGVSGAGEAGAAFHTTWRATEVVNGDDVLWINFTGKVAGDTYTWDIIGSEDLGTEDTG